MTLRGLIDAVERGEWPDGLWIPAPFAGSPEIGLGIEDAFHGSLDAAKRLHDALLPDHRWTITPYWASADMKISSIWAENTVAAKDGNPARAWLLAILRALEGEP